tara:strand:- start:945 stop:3806 length:2862 start_codon:yes stop_codon:yes gene_type:complete
MLRISILFFLVFSTLFSQENFPINGVRQTNQTLYAFTNVDIYIDYNTKINNGTLIVFKDKIFDIGKNIKIPKQAQVIDLTGHSICPSFIDIYSEYGQIKTNNESTLSSWNQALKIEFDAVRNFKINKKDAEKFIKNGFGVLNTLRKDGIIRGSSCLLTLSYNNPHESILQNQSSLCLSFKKGSSKTPYPKSLMGSIALIRQAYYDLDWYKNQKNTYNQSMEAFKKKYNQIKIFEVSEYNSIFRAAQIASEFKDNYIYKTAGDEYQRADEIKSLGVKLIVPINFPSISIHNDPYKNLDISLKQLKHVDTAPYNIPILINKGIDLAITCDGIEDFSKFYKNIQKIISLGLDKSDILKALTYNPANFLNIYNEIGSIEKNKKANFLIFSGDLFSKNFTIHQNWINGQKFDIQNLVDIKLFGKYIFTDSQQDTCKIILKNKKVNFSVKKDTSDYVEIKKYNFTKNRLSFIKDGVFYNGVIVDSIIQGEAYDSLGNWLNWKLVKINDQSKSSKETNKKISKVEHSPILFPNMAYGNTHQPKQESILFKNATIWTNEVRGIIQNCDIAIENGRIISVDKNLDKSIFKSNSKVKIIDASDKHITSGIIDEHSHIAIKNGVNEGTQAVTAEVRIGDVINPNDINIYRQLAGGVTIAQLLHGSANPIGGQSAIIKLKWGEMAEQLKYKHAKPFIKFALGENVKQSNWGHKYKTRFPQTRMGVEQIIYDAFVKAEEYRDKQKEYTKYKNIPKPRRNLELDPLVEILNKERFITCHSYIQSEILMLMHLAERFNFTINTFTHILEGYKVAEKLKEHGANASTFSDWWAYKFEVNDAIPHNAALLTQAGVNTAINSDDAEMGRRLNQEAAKMIKYGNMTQEEAWKSVTLNPAIMLHIDQYVGSLKKNKDADIVIWSSNPLSNYAIVEKTYIEGRCYYSIEKDLEHREKIKKEKARLLHKLSKEDK